MKRKITAILLVISLLFSFAVIFASAETNKLGDINNDGKITAADARKTLRASAKLEELNADQMKAADVDFNGRVSAADARLILRVSAKIDTFAQAPAETTTKKPAETTTKKPSETTTKKPAESTTKKPSETTTSEDFSHPDADPGVVVEEYPDAIDAFFNGVFYLNGQMADGKNSIPLKMATSKQGAEIAVAMPGTSLNVSIYSKGKETYLKLSSSDKKHYIELTDSFKEEFADITEMLTLLKVSNPGKPVLTKGIITDAENNEIKCDIYTFYSADDSSSIIFYAVEDKVIQISMKDASSVESNIVVNELSSKIPGDMLSLKGYSKTTILFLPALYPEFSGL